MTGTTRTKGRTDFAEIFAAGQRIAPTNVVQKTGTTYTFAVGDAGNYLQFTNGSAVTATVPTNASASFPIGSTITFEQNGAGQVTVAGAGGVTVNATPTLKSNAQYAVAMLIKVATNAWTLTGNLATS